MKILTGLVMLFFLVISALAVFYFFYMQPRHVVPILMYHSISANPKDSLCVSPGNFKKQMEFLHDNNYRVISLDRLVNGIKENKKFDNKTVVITFDDGFEDNYIHAFPTLVKYDMPASIFLITNYIGKRDGYLKWDQVILMGKNKIDFGGHTRSDQYLPAIKSTEKLWDEVSNSRTDIFSNTGKEANYFCYPIGGFTEKVENAVKRAGYKGACTTNRGPGRLNKNVYALKRVKITDSDMSKPLHFRAKLSGYYNLFRGMKKSG